MGRGISTGGTLLYVGIQSEESFTTFWASGFLMYRIAGNVGGEFILAIWRFGDLRVHCQFQIRQFLANKHISL